MRKITIDDEVWHWETGTHNQYQIIKIRQKEKNISSVINFKKLYYGSDKEVITPVMVEEYIREYKEKSSKS